MNTLTVPLLVLSIAAADTKPVPKFPIGKETTYVTGPLDKDGYIDYEAALNERLGKGISPEKNSAVLLWKAIGPAPEGKPMPTRFFNLLRMEEPPKNGDYFIGLRAYAKDNLHLDPNNFGAILDQLDRATERPWVTKDCPEIASWLKANEKPLALAIRGCGRPDYFNPILVHYKDKNKGMLFSPFATSWKMYRELAEGLAVRALLRVGDGKFDDAWRDLIACHRLGRLIARGGTVTDDLVGIAIDLIASRVDLAYIDRANLTIKQVRKRLQDLGTLPPIPPLADTIDLGERCICLDCVRIIRRGGAGFDGPFPAPMKASAAELKGLDEFDWDPSLRMLNAWIDKQVVALRLKDRKDREKAIDKIDEELKALKAKNLGSVDLLKVIFGSNRARGEVMGNTLVTLLLPPLRKIENAHDRATQVQRNLHIAFALAGYHQEHKRYPAELDQLAPKYLATVPGDVFSGKPLIYRTSEKGYLLYSVGVNGRDDQGRSYDDVPPGDDLAVQMPLPERKREN